MTPATTRPRFACRVAIVCIATLLIGAVAANGHAEPTAAASGAATVASVDPSGDPMPVGDLDGWRQVFTDDFATDVPLGSFPAAVSAKWGVYPSPTPDSFHHGIYSPLKVVSVHGGILNKYIHSEDGKFLVAALLPKVPGSSSNGQMYGRYTIRFKMDEITGYKVAWLLWPDSKVWPRDGEIDFPERDLTNPNLMGFVHHQDATTGSDQSAVKVPYDSTAWHTTVIEWSPGLVVFRLDGVEIKRITDRAPNTPMHWVIQTETMLTSTPPPLSAAGNVQIDWVAAWQYDPTVTATTTTTTTTTTLAPTTTTTTVAPDRVGPVSALTSPKAGTTWARTVTLAATASDPSGVSAVKWFVDGREVAYDANGAPWTATYNTKLSRNGSHTVFVKARDRLGNWGTSPITTVRIAN